MKRWCISASIYACSEVLSSYLSNRDISKDRAFRTVLCGATADSVLLRAYHIGIDSRIKSPVVRMGIEQICIAPFYDAGYLTVVNGNSWSLNDWWEIYKHDCCFWPIVSYAGYRFVPTKTRYIYVSCMSLVWSTWRASHVESN
jgi:hypothetical protein